MTCMAELEEYGWEEEIRAAGSRILPAALTDEGQQQALTFAKQIARHPATHTTIAKEHLGESEALVLALRTEHQHDLLWFDEFAARAVAKQAGVKLSGFHGRME